MLHFGSLSACIVSTAAEFDTSCGVDSRTLEAASTLSNQRCACAAKAMCRSFEAVLRMRAATMAAPKPLSMLTTETPGELETRAESSGVTP